MDPIIPALVNGLVPIRGIGYLMIGQQNKGITFLILTLVIYFLIIPIFIISWVPLLGYLFFLFGFGAWLTLVMVVLPVFSAIDVYKLADRLHNGFPIMASECGFAPMKHIFRFFVKPSFVTDGPGAPEEWWVRTYSGSNVVSPVSSVEPNLQPQSEAYYEPQLTSSPLSGVEEPKKDFQIAQNPSDDETHHAQA